MFYIASIALHEKLFIINIVDLCLQAVDNVTVDNPIPSLIINGTMNRGFFEFLFVRRKNIGSILDE
jgi:hypothetical protein